MQEINTIPVMVDDKRVWIEVPPKAKQYYTCQFCPSGRVHANMRKTVEHLMCAAYKQGQQTNKVNKQTTNL